VERQKTILLWGAGSQARLVEAMLRDTEKLSDASAVFDPLGNSDLTTDLEIIRDVKTLAKRLPDFDGFVVCIGNQNGFARVKIGEFLAEHGLLPVSVFSPWAILDPTSQIGRGSVVMPGVIVQKFCSVGGYAILNTGACIDHECTLGRGVHVMGQAAVAGRVTVGAFATLGTNSTILPDVAVGAGAYVGAGSVVLRDIGEDAVVVGNPARTLRHASPQFDGALLTALATEVARLA
jgi:sugar O-acyltransferase (sialic acid O-acetyltransferase NeuD family)